MPTADKNVRRIVFSSHHFSLMKNVLLEVCKAQHVFEVLCHFKYSKLETQVQIFAPPCSWLGDHRPVFISQCNVSQRAAWHGPHIELPEGIFSKWKVIIIKQTFSRPLLSYISCWFGGLEVRYFPRLHHALSLAFVIALWVPKGPPWYPPCDHLMGNIMKGSLEELVHRYPCSHCGTFSNFSKESQGSLKKPHWITCWLRWSVESLGLLI